MKTMIYREVVTAIRNVRGVFVAVLLLSAMPCSGAPTSENNERLRQALKAYPEADANKDGVLTVKEARDYRAAAAKKGDARQGRGRQQHAPKTVSGKAVREGSEVKGYNGLYMGHSFFRPAAFDLLSVIPDTSIINHTECIVMQGGQGGSPGFLWDNPNNRKKGQDYLDSGKADLLVMTYYSPADSSVEHYSKWFDYAISKNPDMTFMVALAWGKAPHKAGKEFLEGGNKRMSAMHDSLIRSLRRKYPDNTVLFCPYGLGVYELIERLHDGKLPGVKHVLNPDRNSREESKRKKEQLVNDETGHGGELVARLSALLWLQTLYDYDLSKMEAQTVEGLPDVNVSDIAIEVAKQIAPYNSIDKGKR